MVGLTAAGLVTIGAPTFAARPVTETTHWKHFVEPITDLVLACSKDSPFYIITSTSNAVFHSTFFAAGREHDTFTQTGRFVAVPDPLEDPALPSYTGRFTVRGNFNENGKTVQGSDTFNLRGTGSDGSRISIHANDHFNVRPNGTVKGFFRCR
jgi:hypothetical protein